MSCVVDFIDRRFEGLKAVFRPFKLFLLITAKTLTG